MKKLAITVFILTLCCLLVACNIASDVSDAIISTAESSTDQISTEPDISAESEAQESEQSQQSEISIEVSEEPTVDITTKNSTAFRLSSIYDTLSSGEKATYKVVAPYDDTYTLTCKSASKIAIYDNCGELIGDGSDKLTAELKKDKVYFIEITASKDGYFTLDASLKEHTTVLPYEINSAVDTADYSTSGDKTVNPMTACEIKYTKRTDDRAMYINCNNPEALSATDVNTCLTTADVSERDVFFTYEHNNNLSSMGVSKLYYGYRVTNVGDSDLFITVKNVGNQVGGAGTWLGEDEWVKFYNVAFRVDDSGYTASQKSNYDAYVGFANNYAVSGYQPITYVIPAGAYIYVIGGTTADAYNQINVFGTANKSVSGGCSNGAVIFSTYGSKAQGDFVVYNDVQKLKSNMALCAQNGYVGNDKSGSQYVGFDNCHGVVDADLVWVFNDLTPGGTLPVSYTNPYYLTSGKSKGNRYEAIQQKYFTAKSFTNAKSWVTHINPNGTANAVGTDMTFYETVDSVTKEPITIDYMHYDGKGNTANIGNWMVDYIDTVTLVNQGDTDRTFTYSMQHNGVILAFIRDQNGDIVKEYAPNYCIDIAASTYGAAIKQDFSYKVTVPAHSVVRFSVDYNLLANSCGYINHTATLGK